MVAKLFRFEMKSTARIFLPLYGALLALTLVNKLLYLFGVHSIEHGIMDISGLGWLVMLVYGVMGFLYGALLIAIFVLAVVVMVQRFYKNLLGDEGYLMFTLPVSAWSHLAVKGLAACVWVVASTAVGTLSMAILSAGTVAVDFSRVDWTPLRELFGLPVPLLFLELALLMLIGVFCAMQPVYNAIAIGHFWPKHRIIGSFAAYMAISICWQAAAALLLAVLALLDRGGAVSLHFPGVSAAALMQGFLGAALLAMLVQGGVHFFLTGRILTRRLNLE